MWWVKIGKPRKIQNRDANKISYAHCPEPTYKTHSSRGVLTINNSSNMLKLLRMYFSHFLHLNQQGGGGVSQSGIIIAKFIIFNSEKGVGKNVLLTMGWEVCNGGGEVVRFCKSSRVVLWLLTVHYSCGSLTCRSHIKGILAGEGRGVWVVDKR